MVLDCLVSSLKSFSSSFQRSGANLQKSYVKPGKSLWSPARLRSGRRIYLSLKQKIHFEVMTLLEQTTSGKITWRKLNKLKNPCLEMTSALHHQVIKKVPLRNSFYDKPGFLSHGQRGQSALQVPCFVPDTLGPFSVVLELFQHYRLGMKGCKKNWSFDLHSSAFIPFKS